jgi:hypothetical protein
LRGKKASSQVFEEIEQKFATEKSHRDLEKLTVKISLKDLTQEMKIQEASKPLYLRRYE